MEQKDKVLKVVFLVGSDSRSTRLCLEKLCVQSGIEPLAVILDTARPGRSQRFQNLRRNIRTNGWGYIPHRILGALRDWAEAASFRAAVDPDQVRSVLRTAFPERFHSLEDLGHRFGFPILRVENLNSPEAIKELQKLQPDLGIVLGTRVLKPALFSVPRLGCINLHKGKVPDYRGMPPGFWELHENASSAGVTVHFVDQGLDTGAIVSASDVPILPTDTPVSLLEKLHQEGATVLAEAVAAIQRSHAEGQPPPCRPQPAGTGSTRTRPTLRQIAELRSKLPHWKYEHPLYTAMKALYCLALYRAGVYTLARWWHSRDTGRAAILLYHRVNDYSKDPLTVDTETFAAQLLTVAKHYSLSSTAALVGSIERERTLEAPAVAIHFDDCYQDILTNGAPVLSAVGGTATAFIATGFIDTERTFEHDRQKYPFKFPMLRATEIQEWVHRGFEVGAHTVNHVDLGSCPPATIRDEVVECGRHLENLLGQRVTLFSFPFGRIGNIRGEAVQIIREAYTALFSAHGGFIGSQTDPFDIPRMGVSYEASPLYLLLQLEGLAPSQVAQWFKR